MAKAKLPLQKHTMNFYEGDVEELAALVPSVDVSVLIRDIIHDTIQTIKDKAGAPDSDLKVKVEL